MFLIAAGAILRYAINVNSDVVNIETVGLILMIVGGAGLALSLLYELVQTGRPRQEGRVPRSAPRAAATTTPPAASSSRSRPSGGPTGPCRA